MAETEGGKDARDRGRPEWVSRWKPGEPLPWAKFDWARWLATPALRRLTPEQRGRFMDVFANTHGTRTPGVMTEEDVRLWAGYTREEWKANREAFAQVFNTTRQRGKWRLEDVVDVWKASMTVARRNHERARKAAGSRSRNATGRNEMTSTSTAPSSAPRTRQAQLGADQMLETQPFGLRESEKPSVPEMRSGAGGSAGHSPVASGGTDAVPALLERALRAGSADGTGGTARRVAGGS